MDTWRIGTPAVASHTEADKRLLLQTPETERSCVALPLPAPTGWLLLRAWGQAAPLLEAGGGVLSEALAYPKRCPITSVRTLKFPAGFEPTVSDSSVKFR